MEGVASIYLTLLRNYLPSQIMFVRSLKANILVKAVYGSFVPVLDGENL